jgi:hypothetical protein
MPSDISYSVYISGSNNETNLVTNSASGTITDGDGVAAAAAQLTANSGVAAAAAAQLTANSGVAAAAAAQLTANSGVAAAAVADAKAVTLINNLSVIDASLAVIDASLASLTLDVVANKSNILTSLLTPYYSAAEVGPIKRTNISALLPIIDGSGDPVNLTADPYYSAATMPYDNGNKLAVIYSLNNAGVVAFDADTNVQLFYKKSENGPNGFVDISSGIPLRTTYNSDLVDLLMAIMIGVSTSNLEYTLSQMPEAQVAAMRTGAQTLLKGFGFGKSVTRNTPVIDMSNNLIWINDGGFGSQYISALDLSGNIKHQFDIGVEFGLYDDLYVNPWLPAGDKSIDPRSSGLRELTVKNISDTEVEIYFGIVVMPDYLFRNFSFPGTSQNVGQQCLRGSYNKIRVDLSSNTITDQKRFYTTPTELLPVDFSNEQVLPNQCFGNYDLSYVNLNISVSDGMPITSFSSGKGISSNGDRNIYLQKPITEMSGGVLVPVLNQTQQPTFDGSVLYRVAFGAADTSLNLASDVNWVATPLMEVSGVMVVNPDISSINVNASYIISQESGIETKMFCEVDSSFVFSQHNGALWAKSVLYELNYYGCSVWQQGTILKDNRVAFAVGNNTRISSNDSLKFSNNEKNYLLLLNKYSDGIINFDELQSGVLELYTFQTTPRGNRNFVDSVVVLNTDTFELVNVYNSLNYDTWTLSAVGGINAYTGAGELVFGDKNNTANLFKYGPDGDCVGPVEMNNGRMGTITKSGIAMIMQFDENAGNTYNDDYDDEAQGITELTKSPSTNYTYAGYGGSLGGANYSVATDGDRLFGVLANNECFLIPNKQTLDWTTQEGTSFPRGHQYISALDLSGKILWEELCCRGKLIPSASPNQAPGCLTVHKNNTIYCNAAGMVLAFNSSTGTIERAYLATNGVGQGKVNAPLVFDRNGYRHVYTVYMLPGTAATSYYPYGPGISYYKHKTPS